MPEYTIHRVEARVAFVACLKLAKLLSDHCGPSPTSVRLRCQEDYHAFDTHYHGTPSAEAVLEQLDERRAYGPDIVDRFEVSNMYLTASCYSGHDGQPTVVLRCHPSSDRPVKWEMALKQWWPRRHTQGLRTVETLATTAFRELLAVVRRGRQLARIIGCQVPTHIEYRIEPDVEILFGERRCPTIRDITDTIGRDSRNPSRFTYSNSLLFAHYSETTGLTDVFESLTAARSPTSQPVPV